MIELAGKLGLEGVRWVAPRARSGSWYPHRFMRELDWNEPQLSGAIEVCDQMVTEVSEDGRLGPDRLVVVGFPRGRASQRSTYCVIPARSPRLWFSPVA